MWWLTETVHVSQLMNNALPHTSEELKFHRAVSDDDTEIASHVRGRRWDLFGVRATLTEHTTVYAMDRRGHGGAGTGTRAEP